MLALPEIIDMADRSIEENCHTMLISCIEEHIWMDLFPIFFDAIMRLVVTKYCIW